MTSMSMTVRGLLIASAFIAVTATVASPAMAQAQRQPAAKAPAAQPAANPTPASPAAAPLPPFPNIQQLVQKSRETERKIIQEREARFQGELAAKQEETRKALARRAAAEARSAQLDRAYESNEKRIAEFKNLLNLQSGNLGELFGVTRQVAGDAANVLKDSLLTTQFKGGDGEERSDFLRRLASAKELPAMPELERLWKELLQEMISSGEVVNYTADVIQSDKTKKKEIVTRVGPFTVVTGPTYLGYLPSEKSLTVLEANLAVPYQQRALALQATPAGSGYVPAVVDPARGAIIGLFLDRPSVIQRIERGEAVGYVIIAVGLLGLVLAAGQILHLVVTRSRVNSQLRQMERPDAKNPLGRVLIEEKKGIARGLAPEMLELRISEAVLREVPQLERFQAFLRLAVAAGPLLGLIGTVIGMIITFRVIVASGSSDPKLMATGIGQAMIATVLGLGIAIPLLFINSALAGLSRGIIQILDEESQALIGKNAGSKSSA